MFIKGDIVKFSNEWINQVLGDKRKEMYKNRRCFVMKSLLPFITIRHFNKNNNPVDEVYHMDFLEITEKYKPCSHCGLIPKWTLEEQKNLIENVEKEQKRSN